jgi:hypothetical protein
MKSILNRSVVARSVLACAVILATVGITHVSAQQKLKSYKSDTKDFWTNPPDDWFLGDETEAQKGLAPPSGPPTGASDKELADMMKKIKLPEGFKIEVYASGVLAARQMAWGDNGTLFVGSFGIGNVYAITDKGGKKEVKTILKGMKMPTGIAFQNGALYVIDIDKLIRYDNAEANLDNLGTGKVVYDDMPSYAAHGWKYLAPDKDGWFYVPFGPPFNIGIPPTSLSQIRRVDPKTGNAEIVALGVRNSVGGDVDPRNGECARLDQRRHAERQTQHDHQARRAFRLSALPPGRHAGSKIRHGAPVFGIHAAGAQSRRARGSARHEVLHRRHVPGGVQEQHLHRRAWILESAQISGRTDQACDRRSRWQERQAGDLRLRLDRGRSGLSRPPRRCSAGEGWLAADCG